MICWIWFQSPKSKNGPFCGLAEQRFILDLIFFSESQVRFMIHSHKTQILWSTSYKSHYACRWSSWHYNHHQLKRRMFFTWDGGKKNILPLGRGESAYFKRILRGEEETTVICLTWPLRVGNKPTSWGFVAPFNLEKPRSCFSNDFQVKKGYMSPKVVRFGTSDMNFQEFHQKIPSRSFKRWWLVSFLLFSPQFPNKNPKPRSPSYLAARRLQKTNL